MKKRLLTVLIAVCLVVALGTVTALADDVVASVGGTEYSTLQEAIDAAEKAGGGTITLLRSVESGEITFDTSGEYILDLAGNTFTSNGDDIIEVKAGDFDLTIRNGSLSGPQAGTYGIYAYATNNNVTITLESVDLYATDQGLGVQGLNTNNNLIVRNSTVRCDGTAIYFPPISGDLVIEDSTITGVNNGIYVKGGNVTVSGNSMVSVTRQGNGVPASAYTGGSRLPSTGIAIYAEGGYVASDGSPRPINVTIEGGTIKSVNQVAVSEGHIIETNEDVQKLEIVGGTFLTNNSKSDVEAYIPEGSVLKQDGNGTIVVDESAKTVANVDGVGYTDLASAIAAADDGDTVEIINDCKLESSVAIRENITIEGGNHTVTANGAAFYIQADLESFTVQNLTLKGAEYSGTYGEGNDDNSGPWMGIGTYNGGYGVADLTLTNVTIDGFSYGLYFGGSTTNTNPVSVDADNLVIQNCAIKGAYFEKLTDSEFTDCQILNNGADATKVDSNFTSWMCGVDINLKYGDYENIVFDGCNFEGNGANNGTALHVKARDDGNYSTDSASLTGVTVTGCTFEDNHGTNDIIIGEPNAGNKTPVDVNIQPDVPFTNNLAENATFTVEFKGDYTDDLPVRVVASGDEITLPTPTRSGYEFRGWRDNSGKLHKAGDVVTVNSDMTFTAVWSAINIPDTYDIEIADAANGEVDTSLSNASAGSTITITATPDSGYSVASVTVTGPDGRVDVTRVNATTYTFKMPAGDVTVRVTFTDSEALPFTDVSAGQWFYDAVAYVYTNGMMEGDSATTFNPDGTMTRAMFWAVLGRIDGATITGTNWADQARDWAMAEGVSDGTDPNGLVTREQMVTMLWRYAGEPESSASLSAYTDADSVSDWAETAMRWAIDEGIITGMTDTTLVPQGTATRAQCAAIFMRFDQM